MFGVGAGNSNRRTGAPVAAASPTMLAESAVTTIASASARSAT